MDARLLTEGGWKTTVTKFRIRDNGLQRALGSYERLEEGEHDARLAGITSVVHLAGVLKRDRAVAAVPGVVKYLTDLLSAAEAEKRRITLARAQASRAAAAEQSQGDQDRENEQMQRAYREKLLAGLHRLRGSRSLSYQFIVCDAHPHCGVMVAERITSQHKEELSRVTGGSRRFLQPGTCRCDNNHFAFSMGRPVTGLARKLQDSIKHFTGQNLPIVMDSGLGHH